MKKTTAVTMNFFPTGDDLPLFSGAPVAAACRPFVPAPVARQESLLDLRLDPFHTLDDARFTRHQEKEP